MGITPEELNRRDNPQPQTAPKKGAVPVQASHSGALTPRDLNAGITAMQHPAKPAPKAQPQATSTFAVGVQDVSVDADYAAYKKELNQRAASDTSIGVQKTEAEKRKNYTKAARDAEERLAAKEQPFVLDAEGNATVLNPSAHVRDHEAELHATLVQDAADRMKAGYYKGMDLTKLVDGHLLNHVTGDFIDDGSIESQYMKDMNHQLEPYMEQWRQKYKSLSLIASDGSRMQGNEWKMSAKEIEGVDDAGKNFLKGASNLLLGVSNQLMKFGAKANIALGLQDESDFTRGGYKNVDESFDAAKLEASDIVSDLGSAVRGSLTKHFSAPSYKEKVGGMIKGYADGVAQLNTTALASEARSALEATATTDDGKKIHDKYSIWNALFDGTVNMAGDFVGGMGPAMKAASAPFEAGQAIVMAKRMGRFNKMLRTTGENVLEGVTNREAGYILSNMNEVTLAKAMATPEYTALKSFTDIIGKGSYQTAESVAKHWIGFGLNAYGKNANLEEAKMAAEDGAIFGLINRQLAGLFSRVMTGKLGVLSKLKGMSHEDLKLIEPHLQRKVQIASMLSNIAGNPLGGVIADAWRTGSITGGTDWDEFSRKFIINTIQGGLFGVHEAMNMQGAKTSKELVERFKAKKEYYESLAAAAKDGTTMEGIVDMAASLRDKVNKAQTEAESEKKPTISVADFPKPAEPARKPNEQDARAMEEMMLDSQELDSPETKHILDEAIAHEEKAALVKPTEPVRGGDVPMPSHFIEDGMAPLPLDDVSNLFGSALQPEVKTEHTQLADLQSRHKLLYGEDFAPEKSSLMHLMNIATTPLFDGDAVHKSTLDAFSLFLKKAPKGTKVELHDVVEVEGTERAMAYDEATNTVHISKNKASSGNLHQMAHTLSEELTHQWTVGPLSTNPELASNVDNIRKEVLQRYTDGEFDGLWLRSYENQDISVKSAQGRAAMDYILGTNEEFVANSLNGDFPLREILEATKLDGQKRYNAFDRLLDQFKGISKDEIKAYQKMHGSMPLFAMPVSHVKAEYRRQEQALRQSMEEDAQLTKAEKANERDLSAVFGVPHASEIMGDIAERIVNSGLEATLDYGKAMVKKWGDTSGVTNPNQIKEMEAKVVARIKAYARSHGNDQPRSVLAIKAEVADDGSVRHTSEIIRPRDMMSKKGESAPENFVKSRPGGKPFSFLGNPMTAFASTMKSAFARAKNSGHATGFIKGAKTADGKEVPGLLELISAMPPADVQYYKGKDGTLSSSFPSNITAQENYDLRRDILMQTGHYVAPRGAGGAKVHDARKVLNMISDLNAIDSASYFPAVGAKPIAEAMNHVHNYLTYEWLASADGGNKPELAKQFGGKIDIGKLLKLDIGETSPIGIDELMAKTVWDPILAHEKMNPATRKHLEEAAYDVKAAAALREAVLPLWQNPYNGQMRPFGAERVSAADQNQHSKADAAMEIMRLMTTIAVDPSLKSFSSKTGIGMIVPNKMAHKYVGVGYQGQQYNKIKDYHVFKALVNDKYADHFDEAGDPIAEQWNRYGVTWKKTDKGWSASEKVMRFDVDAISDKYPQIAALLNTYNTDGASIFLNDAAWGLYNDVVGTEEAGTFKNAHVWSDADHTIITKTAYHKIPTTSDNPEYAEINNFLKSLKQQGFNRIKFTSSIKSGGTFRMKEGLAEIPGLENEPVQYNNKGQCTDKAIQEATYNHILAGGVVPKYMEQHEDLFGENGQSFISAADANKNFRRAMSQIDLAHYQPGGEYYDKYAQYIDPMRAVLKQRRDAIEAAHSALRFGSIEGKEKEVGYLMSELHNRMYDNLASDDRNIQQSVTPEMLEQVAKSYVQDDNGDFVATDYAKAIAASYGKLLYSDGKKPSVFGSMYHDIVEDHEKNMVFGQSLKLVPTFFPADALDYAASKEMDRIKQGDSFVAGQKRSELEKQHALLYETHIDPKTGGWMPNSNGMIVGEHDLRILNEQGRRRFGKQWKEVKLGSNVLSDLKPTDAASSNAPMVIIGIIKDGRGIAISPDMAKNTGRDYDNDALGIIPDSPMWQDKFESMHEAMSADGVGINNAERVINGASFDQLVKMAEQNNRSTNLLAEHLNAPTDFNGYHPLDGKAHDVRILNADTGQGMMVSKIASYSQYVRDLKLSGNADGIIHLEDANGKPTVAFRLNPDIQDVQARMSFIKQYGAVDGWANLPVAWDKAFNNAIVSDVHVNGQWMPVRDFADQHPRQYEQAFGKLGKMMSDVYTGSKRHIEKVSQLGGSDSVTIDGAAEKLRQESKYAGGNSPIADYLSELGATQGVTAKQYEKADDHRKELLLKAQGRALRSGLESTFAQERVLYKIPGERKVGQAISLKLESGGGKVNFVVKRKGAADVSFHVKDAFDPDGTINARFAAGLKNNDIPLSVFFSENAENYAPKGVSDSTPVSFVRYNGYSPETRSRTIANAIVHYAKLAENPALEAGELIAGHLGTDISAVDWHEVVKTVRDAGITPVVNASQEHMIGTAKAYDPVSGEWKPLEKRQGKWNVVDAAEPIKGEVLSTEVTESGGVRHEEHLVRVPQSFESHLVGRVSSEIKKAREAKHGSFNMMKKHTKDILSSVSDGKSPITEMTSQESIANVMKRIEDRLTEEFGKLPTSMIHDTLEAINPGYEFTRAMASGMGVEEAGKSAREFAFTHLYDTVEALRRVNDSQQAWRQSKIGQNVISWRFTENRSAAAIVQSEASLNKRKLVRFDDPIGRGYQFTNGETLKTDEGEPVSNPVLAKQTMHDGEQFAGAINMSEDILDYAMPLADVVNTKRVETDYLHQMSEVGNEAEYIDPAVASEYVRYAKTSGVLETNPPPIKISTSYNTLTNEADASMSIEGYHGANIEESLNKYYAETIKDPAERAKICKGIAVLAKVQRFMQRQANFTGAKALYLKDMVSRAASKLPGTDIINEEATQALLKAAERRDYYKQATLQDAFNELLSVDAEKASVVLSDILSPSDTGYGMIFMSDPLAKGNPREANRMMHYAIGQKLFGWGEAYGKSSENPKQKERLLFMQNLLTRHKNMLEENPNAPRAPKIIKGFEDSREAFAKAMEPVVPEEIASKITTGQIMEAIHEITEDNGVAEAFDTLGAVTMGPSLLHRRLKSEAHEQLTALSRTALKLYNLNPDSNYLAHTNMAWLLSNPEGKELRFDRSHDIAAVTESINANMKLENGLQYAGDTPLLRVGKMQMVSANNNGEHLTFKGRYVGAFRPNASVVVDGEVIPSGIDNGTTMAIFHNDSSGTTHIVNTNAITSMIENSEHGMVQNYERRAAMDRMTPEFIQAIASGTKIYYDDYGNASAMNAAMGTAEEMAKGVRSVPLTRAIEGSLLKGIRNTQVGALYTGKSEATKIALGLGGMAMDMVIPGSSWIGGVAGALATDGVNKLISKIGRNYFSNPLVGARTKHWYQDGSTIGAGLKHAGNLLDAARNDNTTKKRKSTAAIAAEQKLKEGQPVTSVQDEAGVSGSIEDFNKDISNLMFMNRMQQRFQAIADESFPQHQKNVSDMIAKVDRTARDSRHELEQLSKRMSWSEYLKAEHPELYAEAESRGVLPVVRDGKVVYASEAARLAESHMENMGDLRKWLFVSLNKMAGSGNAGISYIGKILAGAQRARIGLADGVDRAIGVMSASEVKSVREGLNTGEQVWDIIQSKREEAGLDKVDDPILKEKMVERIAEVATGNYERNAMMQSILGARLTLFTSFNQNRIVEKYTRYNSKQGHYEFLKQTIDENPEFEKYVNSLGILKGDLVALDRKRLLKREGVVAAMPLLSKVAVRTLGMALGAMFGMAAGQSDEEKVVEMSDMAKSAGEGALSTVERLWGADDPAVQATLNGASVLAEFTPFMAMASANSVVEDADGEQSIRTAPVSKMEKSLDRSTRSAEELARFGGSPLETDAVKLATDLIVLGFLTNEKVRSRYGDFMQSNQIDESPKAKRNAELAVRNQADMVKLSALRTFASQIAPVYGPIVTDAVVKSTDAKKKIRNKNKQE